MAAPAVPAGTAELVDAALAPYAHADLRWLVRRHVHAVLLDFPAMSPSVDTYTSDDGASAVLLNVRGLLAVDAALPPLLVTLWLPREYPFRPPLVYALPAAPPAALVADHPFVDHRTGRVRRALPCLDGWRVPESTLAGLLRGLVGALRMCHPLTAGFAGDAAARATAPPEEEEETPLVAALAARLGRDAAAHRRRVDHDIHAMSSLQASLRARGDAVDRAVGELEEERLRLEHAVTASLRHRGELLRWLGQASRASDAAAMLEPRAAAAAGGDADAARWVESKASELAVDDAMDALGHALEDGAVGLPEYMKRVKVLAREQFFHCYAASTALSKRIAIHAEDFDR
ncbi:hypothetical protein ACP4OV_003451 [Aristida adscensionis]